MRLKRTFIISILFACMLLSCTGTVSAATYSGGSGTEGDPYLLSSDSDIDTLSATSADWGSYFQMTQDITLVGNHTPIGDGGTLFSGNFDGNGFAVTNLTVYHTSTYAGFFGYTQTTANIHDLEVETSSDGVVSTGFHVGALIGQNQGIVSNCSSTGIVTGSGSSEYVGGLIGSFITSGSVSNCSANVTVTGPSHHVGGLIGACDQPVSNCYAIGNVIGGNLYAGGLMGRSWGAVSNSYATGNVTGPRYVGGLIGYKEAGTVSNSFATGTVDGALDSGAFIGLNAATVTNCYYSGTPATGAGTSTPYSNFMNYTFVSGPTGLNWNASGDIITTEVNSSFIWRIDDGFSLPYFQTPAVTPVASFSSNITSGQVPLTIGFTDLSLNTPTSWFWDFGDGTNSTEQNPTHTYTSAGTYDVSLNATNAGGSNVSIQLSYITTAVTPVANFTSNVTEGIVPLSVNFTDLSQNSPTSWFWDFGDGNTSTDQNPTHVYASEGTYNVSLNATNVGGSNISTQVDYITATFLATSVNASNTSVTYDENNYLTVDPGIIVNGSSTFTSARVYIGDGYVENEDFLRFTNTSSINGSFNPVTGILSLSGSGNAADYQEAFRNVRYENIEDNPDTSGRNITFVLGGNTLYSEDTGHYYEYVTYTSTWEQAKTNAETKTMEGMQGYLATITSEEENNFLMQKIQADAWIGANDSIVEGDWRWVTGPEGTEDSGNGRLFYRGTGTSGTIINGEYNKWNGPIWGGGEPNNAGNEDGAQMYSSNNGTWNDLPTTGTTLSGYLLEYGGMPDETAPQLTATITVNINSINDAPGMPGNFTTPLGGASVERGSTVNVSWGESTDLEEDSLVYDLWYFNGTWGQIAGMLNVTSYEFTIPIDDISEAMFKVYANDSVDSSPENNVTFNLTSVVPVSNFTADVTSGMVPLTVNFTDQTSNHPNEWLWDFGDGNTSTDQNPTHTYVSAGTYNVSLNATNPGGSNVSTQLSYIAVYAVPVSNFSADVTEGAAPLSVVFTDLSTNTPTSWSWEFGDGNTSTEQNPTHTYVSAGTYNVSLNATNAVGSDIATQTAYISVYITPVANFTADVTSGTAPLTVSFTDISSNIPTSWLWDFGDGSTSADQNPVHSYSASGSYNVMLNATNVAGSNISVQTSFINVTAASSGSSSGTRTSVGPSLEPDTVSGSDTSVKHVMGGSSVEFDLSDGNGPVVSITFDAKDNEGRVVTKVQVLKERPSYVPSPLGRSYSIMSIDVGAVGTISEDNADNLRIHFKVSREWVEENNIDVSTIRMTRYSGDQWNDLPTYQEREEDGYIYFYAETPGFSIFEVVGDEMTTTTNSEQVPASSSAPVEEEVPEEDEGGLGIIYLILGIAVIVGVAYVVMQKQKSE